MAASTAVLTSSNPGQSSGATAMAQRKHKKKKRAPRILPEVCEQRLAIIAHEHRAAARAEKLEVLRAMSRAEYLAL